MEEFKDNSKANLDGDTSQQKAGTDEEFTPHLRIRRGIAARRSAVKGKFAWVKIIINLILLVALLFVLGIF